MTTTSSEFGLPKVKITTRYIKWEGWVSTLRHDDIVKRKHFPCYWPFVRGIHRSPVNSPHKGQWRGVLVFFYLRLNKQLSKQSRRRCFWPQKRSLWRHYNVFDALCESAKTASADTSIQMDIFERWNQTSGCVSYTNRHQTVLSL